MPKKKSVTDYITCYDERELFEGKLEKALVIILRTKGCYWGRKQGCLMCGYRVDAYDGEVPEDALMEQFESAMQKFDGHKIVKIFNSGSFLDEDEIPLTVRTSILKTLSDKAERIIIESRPEFITEEVLGQVKSITDNLEVALGLETASDLVNKKCINKGSGYDDYEKAAQLLHKKGFRVRTYLLLKPPFLTEQEAVDDVWQSIERIKSLTDVISINPVNIQKGTVVEKLWQNNQYRPPWLWSLLEIFKRTRSWREDDTAPIILSHPSGAGSRRGVHNCKKCDKMAVQSVRKYSDTQSYDVVEEALKIKCRCFEQWQDLLEMEHYCFAAVGRLQ